MSRLNTLITLRKSSHTWRDTICIVFHVDHLGNAPRPFLEHLTEYNRNGNEGLAPAFEKLLITNGGYLT